MATRPVSSRPPVVPEPASHGRVPGQLQRGWEKGTPVSSSFASVREKRIGLYVGYSYRCLTIFPEMFL